MSPAWRAHQGQAHAVPGPPQCPSRVPTSHTAQTPRKSRALGDVLVVVSCTQRCPVSFRFCDLERVPELFAVAPTSVDDDNGIHLGHLPGHTSMQTARCSLWGGAPPLSNASEVRSVPLLGLGASARACEAARRASSSLKQMQTTHMAWGGGQGRGHTGLPARSQLRAQVWLRGCRGERVVQMRWSRETEPIVRRAGTSPALKSGTCGQTASAFPLSVPELCGGVPGT